MNLENYYYCFQKAVPERICDEIIKYAISIKDQMAITGAYTRFTQLNQRQVKNLKKKRDSNIVWLTERWIYKEIHPYIVQANTNAGWNFQWDFSEECQFTKYNKGQYYDWHSDGWVGTYNQPNTRKHGKIRKLSVTLSLSDPKSYKGGELEFDFRNLDPDKKPNIQKCKGILPKGSLVVFPGFVWHRVCPIKKGVRYSLVMWNLGWPFK